MVVKTVAFEAVELPQSRMRFFRMSSLKLRFGKAVRRLRTSAGHSQEAFAALAAIDRGYYGRIERGEVNVSLENVEKIAAALELSVGVVMTASDQED